MLRDRPLAGGVRVTYRVQGMRGAFVIAGSGGSEELVVVQRVDVASGASKRDRHRMAQRTVARRRLREITRRR